MTSLTDRKQCVKFCALIVVSYVLGFYTGGVFRDVKCCEQLKESYNDYVSVSRNIFLTLPHPITAMALKIIFNLMFQSA